MFTGLIADLGAVSSLHRDDRGATIAVRTGMAGEIEPGDSIAVNGVCLTATSVDSEGFAAEAMIETLKRSSLGDLKVGSPVNLELPLRPDSRLGGHIVQGHVDGLGTVVGIIPEGFSQVLEIEPPADLERYLVEKGSIAVDGVSLTVSHLGERTFSVSLIPETLQRTNLGEAAIGTTVNLEVDVLAKHVERLLQGRSV